MVARNCYSTITQYTVHFLGVTFDELSFLTSTPLVLTMISAVGKFALTII